jgi:DNA polymerase I-like protein with 3'-5' exonuclease and polymerase domains
MVVTLSLGMSLWLPDYDRGYYIPVRHGQGRVEVKYSPTNTPDLSYDEMSWQGRTKSAIFLQKAFEAYSYNRDFGNVPLEWLDDLRFVWNQPGQLYVFHNMKFDLAFLVKEGFEVPDKCADSMTAAHLINQDWGETEFSNAWHYKYGSWVKGRTFGNRRLKWLGKLFNIEGAFEGEDELKEAADRIGYRMTELYMHYPDNKYVESIVYSTYAKLFEDHGFTLYYDDLSERQQEILRGLGIRNGKQLGEAKVGDLPNKTLIHARWCERQRNRIFKKLRPSEKANMWMLDAADVGRYAILDTKLTLELYEKLESMILKYWGKGQAEMLEGINGVGAEVAFRMEQNGIRLDREEAERQIAHLRKRAAQIEGEFDHRYTQLTGDHIETININSNPQLLEFFELHGFDDLDAVNKDTLSEYDADPYVQLLLEYRQINKAIGTYLETWLEYADENDIVHPTFKETGTVSGRWSSGGFTGNWQNIPDRAYDIKRALVEYDENWQIVAADYGQLELRVATFFAEGLLGFGNMEMTKLFKSGEDMHAYVRDYINVREQAFPGMSDDEILAARGIDRPFDSDEDKRAFVDRKILRQMAKTLNFGLLYSGTWRMVSKLLDVSEVVARRLEEGWRALFPAFEMAQDYYTDLGFSPRPTPTGFESSSKPTRYVQYPEPFPYVRMNHHARESIPVQYDDGRWGRFDGRMANARKNWNNVVQGWSGFACTFAARRICDLYGNDILRPFGQIHDALEFMVHRDHLDIVPHIMEIMADYDVTPALSVDVEASIDGTWQGMTEIEDMDLWIKTRGVEGYEGGKKRA